MGVILCVFKWSFIFVMTNRQVRGLFRRFAMVSPRIPRLHVCASAGCAAVAAKRRVGAPSVAGKGGFGALCGMRFYRERLDRALEAPAAPSVRRTGWGVLRRRKGRI